MHDVLAVPEMQRLVGHQGRRRQLLQPRVVVLHGEAVRLDVLGDDEMIVGDELVAELQGVEREPLEFADRWGARHA